MKTVSSSLINFQRAKLSTRSITNLCWCIWRIFWRKNAAVRSSRGSFSARQCPCSPGTCNPQETGLPGFPVYWSPTLFSESGPVGIPPVPWTEINNWKFTIFCLKHRSLLLRRPGWTDNNINFFLCGLKKLEQRIKTCIELLGECVE